MTELKIYLSNGLSDRFRRIAMSVYGYGRGSLSKAAEDAFSKWCEQHEQTIALPSSPSSKETRGDAPETKTLIDPEERPGSATLTDTLGNTSVKSTS